MPSAMDAGCSQVPAWSNVDLELRQVLAIDGSVVGTEPDLNEKELVELYRLMFIGRVFDRRAFAAQRQGRLGTYAMLEGHEAVQIGSAMAFGPEDFIYPAYRQHATQIARGMPMEVVLAYWRGLPNEDWDVHRYRMMSVTVPIASQIPHAVGHAYAARRRGEPIVVGTYFGDGATSENDFHSGLNFAGVWKTPNVFICANNLYAISVPYAKQTASETIAQKAVAYGIAGVRVDGMDVLAMYDATKQAVARGRAGEGPTLIEALCYRFGPHATADDARLYRTAEEEDGWREKDPLPRFRRYLEQRSLWDDEQDAALLAEATESFDTAIKAVDDRPLPGRDDIVRHAYSRIPPMVADQLHDIQARAGETPTAFSADELWPSTTVDADAPEDAPTRTMAEAINDGLHLAMEDDPNLILLGEDVGVAGGVFRITQGLLDRFGEDRVIDTPINESGIVGTAIGMAISGTRAIAEIQFDGFLYPAFDQIASHLGRIRFRTRGHASVPVLLRFPTGAGIGAHEHHCDSPEAYLAHAPGLIVVMPSTAYDAKGLLLAALAADDPVAFLEPKVLYHSTKDAVPDGHYLLTLGRARLRRTGSDATLVTYGGMVPPVLRAAEQAAAEGTAVEVIDLRTIYPWDVETVVASVERTGRLLVVQQPQRTGGVAAEIAATVAELAGYSLEAPVKRLGATDAPWPQFAIERHALLDDVQVLAAVRELMAN